MAVSISSALLLLAIAPAAAARTGFIAGDVTQQVNFKSWNRDSGGHGWQAIAPFSVSASFTLTEGLQIDTGLRTAWIVARNATSGSEGEVSTWSDTILPMTFTATNLGEWRPFVSVELNLPTGLTRLRGAQKNALMDPDLTNVVRFGEGLNANFSGGVTYSPAATPWAFSLAAGYNVRGSYVPDGDFSDDFDPGDQLTAIARIQYYAPTLYAALNVSLTEESATELAGFPYFKPGLALEISAEATYALDSVSSLSASIFFQKSARNAYLDLFTNLLIKENVNGNGAYYFGQAAYSRQVTEYAGLSFAATYGVREANAYLPAQNLFLPQRRYWDVRVSGDFTLSKDALISIDLGVGGVHDAATALTPVQDYITVSAGLAFSQAF